MDNSVQPTVTMLKNNNKLDAGYTALPTEKGNLLKVDIPFKKKFRKLITSGLPGKLGY